MNGDGKMANGDAEKSPDKAAEKPKELSIEEGESVQNPSTEEQRSCITSSSSAVQHQQWSRV